MTRCGSSQSASSSSLTSSAQRLPQATAHRAFQLLHTLSNAHNQSLSIYFRAFLARLAFPFFRGFQEFPRGISFPTGFHILSLDPSPAPASLPFFFDITLFLSFLHIPTLVVLHLNHHAASPSTILIAASLFASSYFNLLGLHLGYCVEPRASAFDHPSVVIQDHGEIPGPILE